MLSFRFFIISFLVCPFIFSCTHKDIPEYTEVAGVEIPEITLNGTWKFSMNPPEEFWRNDVDFFDWKNIQVPGECQMQGFAIKHDTPYAYKHNFFIPEDYQGKQILLNFYGVYSYARVWVNGQFVREHYGGFTKWNCDITKHVTPGETAILTVEIIDRIDDISYASGYAKHQIGGILRDVVLTALPKQYFSTLYFETDLDNDYKDAELKAFYKLSQASASKLLIKIYNPENKLIGNKEIQNATQEGEISLLVKNPLKWDAEHPNLYTVVTSIVENDEEIWSNAERIGFREVVVDGNSLLVNGMPVKLRGACRHDIHPLLGRMTTSEYDKKDVLLAKEANMNFIRTSHYPPSEAFLDYCDEYGIYVEDETAVCFVGSHRTFDYQASGASQNHSDFTDRYLSQLEEMVQNHRNHPSVIIWSIGNENVFGSNFVKSYRWVKENDQTRPVIYSYPGPVPDSVRNYEILSMHYPDWKGNLKQYGLETKGFSYKEMPVLFDEWAHVACYNNPTLRTDPNVRNFWGQSLDSMWTTVFEADGGLGGAIWCMIDETFMLPEDLDGFNDWWGKLDPHVIPATYMGPCVGYGEWGIIDTWRRKKPEFWATKKAYSPTKILLKQINDFAPGEELVLPIHNRFDHTDFSELKITYRYGDYADELDNVKLKAHTKGEIIIPPREWEAGEKLYVGFYGPDNMLIDEYLIQLGLPKVDLPKVQKGELELADNEKDVLIVGSNYSLIINKKTGLINNLVIKNDTLIKSGPYINLSIPGKRTQYSTIQMADYTQNWVCTEFDYTLKNGIVHIITKGNYDSIAAKFDMFMDEHGVLSIDYTISNAPEGKMIQESGIKFIMGNQFAKLKWNRNPYFSIYPETDLGRAEGEVDLDNKPAMNYRERPNHEWEMDSKGFYYFGLKAELPFTNIARSLKENIYSFTLSTSGNSKIQILDKGKQACRFDKLDGKNVLIINDQWDYQSLLWGNYSKMIKTEKEIKGTIRLKIE